MSVESVKGFIVAAGSNPALAARIASAVESKTASEAAIAVSELAKSEGFDFTVAEAVEAQSLQGEQLSEDALNGVAGGAAAAFGSNSIAPGEPSGFWAGFQPAPGTEAPTFGNGGTISSGPGGIPKPGGPVF